VLPTQWTEIHLFRNINSLYAKQIVKQSFILYSLTHNKILATDKQHKTLVGQEQLKYRPFGNTEW
jgi:hypothetical protein